MNSSAHLTVAEVAQRLKVSRNTVYSWVTKGHMKHTRYGPPRLPGQRGRGGAIRIPASEVETRLAA